MNKKKFISLLMTTGMACAMLPCIPVQAAMSINIGDYVQMGTYYGQTILWRCVNIDENGPLMLSDRILCLKAFDANGDTTSGSHNRGYYNGYFRIQSGSNYWADSNIRDWLNSDSDRVTWTCGNPPDKEHMLNGYNAYDKEAGFLTNFTQSEKNAMLTVAQKSLLDSYENSSSRNENYHMWNQEIEDVVQNYDKAYNESVTDKMFLLDVKQVNEVYKNSNNLGENYYIGKPTQTCVDNSEYTDSNLNNDNNWQYWLRSPNCFSGRSILVRVVGSDGYVNHSSAYSSSYGIRPAFYLNTTDVNAMSGNGEETNPYKDITLSIKNKAYEFTGSESTEGKTFNNLRLLYTKDNEQYKSELSTGTNVTLSADSNVVFEFDDVPENVTIAKVELY